MARRREVFVGVQPIDKLATFARNATADPPGTLIVLDVDGTIAPIAPSPGGAAVPAGMRTTLARVAKRYRLWFISGRDAQQAQRMVAVASAGYIGAHGLEALDEKGLRPLTEVTDLNADLARFTASVLADVPEATLFVERKRWSVAFHYRRLEQPQAVATRLERSIAQHLPEGLRLLPGKMVYEVLPAGQYDKGTAIDWLIDTFQPRRVLAAGDDVTDLPMLQRLAAAAAIERLTIAIRHGRETPAGLLEEADLAVDGPRALEDVLMSML